MISVLCKVQIIIMVKIIWVIWYESYRLSKKMSHPLDQLILEFWYCLDQGHTNRLVQEFGSWSHQKLLWYWRGSVWTRLALTRPPRTDFVHDFGQCARPPSESVTEVDGPVKNPVHGGRSSYEIGRKFLFNYTYCTIYFKFYLFQPGIHGPEVLDQN